MEKNTFFKLKMETDEIIDVTLNFYRLYQLKTKNPEAYKAYFAVTSKGLEDEFSVWQVIYTGYLCAHLDDEELQYPDFESFLQDVPYSRTDMWNCYLSLMGDNKKKVPKSLQNSKEV